jgi:DNA-binding MarR family transcriptional regulator
VIGASIAQMHTSPRTPEPTLSALNHDGHSAFAPGSFLDALSQLGRRDLTFTQLAAIDHIAGGGEPTIAEVAEAIDRSRGATSRLIDDLVRAGLVARRSSEEDRRVKRVRLTAAAKDLLAGLHKAHHDRPRPHHSHTRAP